MGKLCLHGYVSGRVQGVWFRGSTRQRARASQITGWARNLPDGRVEVLLCGEEAAVRALEAWLRRGPPAARVDRVQLESVDWQDVSDFTTG